MSRSETYFLPSSKLKEEPLALVLESHFLGSRGSLSYPLSQSGIEGQLCFCRSGGPRRKVAPTLGPGSQEEQTEDCEMLSRHLVGGPPPQS